MSSAKQPIPARYALLLAMGVSIGAAGTFLRERGVRSCSMGPAAGANWETIEVKGGDGRVRPLDWVRISLPDGSWIDVESGPDGEVRLQRIAGRLLIDGHAPARQ